MLRALRMRCYVEGWLPPQRLLVEVLLASVPTGIASIAYEEYGVDFLHLAKLADLVQDEE